MRSSQSSFSLGDSNILILDIFDNSSWILGAIGLSLKSIVSSEGASFRKSTSISETQEEFKLLIFLTFKNESKSSLLSYLIDFS